MSDVTRLLSAISKGDPHAAADLLPLVYDELRRLASQWLAQEAPGQTLQPTALVHEAFVRLTGTSGPETGWDSRRHFFAACAEAMRRLLVENARRKKRLKRGGDRRRVSLEAAESLVQTPSEDLLAVDEALTRLTAHDPIKAEVVKLRFFAGLTMAEVAQSLDLSLATVERYWTYARTWLYAELTDADEDQEESQKKQPPEKTLNDPTSMTICHPRRHRALSPKPIYQLFEKIISFLQVITGHNFAAINHSDPVSSRQGSRIVPTWLPGHARVVFFLLTGSFSVYSGG
jgi:RNA polymerase sigma factor (TIGR02999 family)